MANINSVITYNANLSAAQAQIKALTGQIGALSAAFNNLDKSAISAQRNLASTFSANVGQIGGFTTQTVKAHAAVENFGKQLAANRLTMREYFREAVAGYTRQNSLMRQLAAQQVRYQQSVAVPMGGAGTMMLTPTSLAATGNAAALASQKFSIFNELIDGGANRLLNFGKNTQWAGRQLMVGFTLPMMLFTGLISKQFRELDQELTRFEKVYGADLANSVSDASKRMRAEVQQLAFDIGRAYGVAAKDTAALAADIAATGREGQALIDSVTQTTRLAVLGEVDRQEAMKATLSLQSAFRMNTNELAESINFLNAVENQTSATLEDLATAIPKVGPVVRSLGGDVKDLATLLVAMREGGIPAAEAANALKSGLSALINPTKQASDVAKQFGIDLVGIVEANRGQLMPTIYAMQEALSGLDSFARSKVIEQIFGRYQFARITALFDNIGRAGSQTEAVVALAANTSAELAAVANKELRTLQESTAMRFTRAMEDVKNALIPVGEILTETLIPIFQLIGQGLRGFIEFFQALPGPIQNFTKYAITITALAGPVIMLVGLFGNLIANGIKFGMMLTRMGAKIAGLRFEKFELLDANVMAAKVGVDNLTTSFTTQEQALRRLSGVMGAYEASLRRLTASNPALFIPGAVPGQRGPAPIRRQAGSTGPEFVPGSGRGDRIPAMLEPGEFVVNREATQRYAPVLMAMNRGNLPGFQQGGMPGSIGLRGGPSTIYSPYTMFAPGNVPGGFGMSRAFFESSALFEKSMRASAITAIAIEKKMRLTDKNMQVLSQLSEPVTRDITEALRATAKEMSETGRDATHISQVMEQARPKVQAILARMTDPAAAAAMQKFLYPTPAQAAAMGNIRVPGVTVSGATGQLSRSPSMYSQRVGEAASFQARLPAAATFMGVPVGGGYTRAHLDLLRMQGPTMPLAGGAMGASPQIRKVAEDALRQYTAKITGDVNAGAVTGVQRGVNEGLRNNSPSKTAQAMFIDDGRDLAMGAVQGLQQGYAQGGRQLTGLAGLARLQQMTGPGPTSAYPRATGPSANIASAQNAAMGGMRGQGAMNAMFAISMLTSSITMMSGASSDAAAKLGLFTTALMTATMLMNTGISGKGLATNFLGLGSAGRALTSRGAASIPAPFAPTMAGAQAARGAGMAGAGNMGLLGAGRALSVLGGPVGIAAGIGVTAAITGFMMYRNAAEEARERAVAAFNDPIKSAEYFGETILSVSDILERNRLSNISEDLEQIDQGLRDVVKEDYAPLIEQIKFLSAGAGAQQLSVAYSNMILSGMSAENAKAAVEAIAAEAGIAGGQAFNEAVAQGMLDEMTTSEAVQRVVGQFQPGEMEYGDTGESLLTVLERDLAELEARKAEIEQLVSRGGRNPQLIAEYNKLTDQIDALADRIQDLSTINPDMIPGMLDSLVMAYQQDPTAAINGLNQFVESLDSLSDSDREAAISRMGEYIQEAYGEQWTAFGSTIDESNEKIIATQMLLAGISLDKAINDANEFDSALGRALVTSKLLADSAAISARGAEEEYFGMISEFAEERRGELSTEIRDLENARDKQVKAYEDKKEAAVSSFEAEQEARQDAIDGMQDEMDARREVFNERMDELQEEKDAIQESSDVYIKSLEKRRRADSFFAQQRKTSLSALQKLASGDVFGFLQERQQMSDQAQEFSYDQEIRGIEERRDIELDAIDETIEKERDKQEEYEKNMQDKIEAQQDLMEAEQEAHEERMKHYDDQIEKVKRVKQTQLNEKRTELKDLGQMEQDYRNNATEAEDKWSKKYSELKERPYVNARKQMLRWRVEEIYFRGEDSLEGALRKAMGPAGSESYAPSGVRPLNTEEMLRDLGFTGSPGSKWSFQPGDTGVGTDGLSRQVQQMNVEAANVTINGDVNGGGSDTIPGPYTGDKPGYRWDGTQYVKLAGGGKVSGPGGPKSDVIPAMLSNGEYVIQASSVKKYGPGLMDAINTQKFAEGGPVEMKKSFEKWIPKDKLSFYNSWDSYGNWPGGKPRGIMMHHTAGVGPGVLQWMARHPEAGKPVVQAMVGRDATAHILAYGGTGWGAGEGGTSQLTDPKFAGLKDDLQNLGSASNILWQVEVESVGKIKDFTANMFDTIARMSSAIREYSGWNTFAGKIINHATWAPGRKNDTLYPISLFEQNANNIWGQGGGTTSEQNNGGKNGKNKDREGKKGSIEGGPGTSPRMGLFGILSLLEKAGGGEKPGRKPGRGNKPGDTPGGNPPSAPGIDKVLSLARKYSNLPYSSSYPIPMDKDGNPTGWGCATSVAWLYRNGAGITLPSPSLSYGQYAGLKQSVSKSNIAPGDLIFYKNNGPSGVNKQNPVNHVEMYMGAGNVFNGGVGIQSGYSNHPIIGIKRPAKFASGGFISGPGGPRSDMIPAMLSNGEYVVKASSVAKYGKGFMDQINAGNFGMGGMASSKPMSMTPMRYADGGFVGSVPTATPTFGMPQMASVSPADISANVSNSFGGDSNSATVNSSKVNVIINASGGKSAKAIANRVISIINEANGRRNHSRSI